ncbi:hypothetical protein DFH29DRAFT_982609 [Suillus ampliporus]|nr:hypothetical protein DFH29DRAFT_982609 [Suillus ampliporus]
MSPSSPNTASVSTLIFSGGEFGSDYPYETQTYDDERPAELSNLGYDQETGDAHEKKPNVYVELFEEMLRTLVETEGHLFDISELDYADRYAKLSPSAKFLMTKLILRKFNAWHRLDSLKYEAEIGSTDEVVQAIDEICSVPGQGKAGAVEEVQIPLDAIPSATNAIAGPSSIKLEDLPMADAKLPNHVELPESVGILAEDESRMDLPTLLECLKVDELRCIAKQMRVKASSKKPDMIHALLIGSCTQSTLSPHQLSSDKPSFLLVARQPRNDCAILFSAHLASVYVYMRVFTGSTQPSQGLLLPALLSRFKKRSYARVAFTRTKEIWPTREALLTYEQALEQEELVDAALAGNFAAAGTERDFKTPAADGLRFKTPVTPNTAFGVPQTPTSGTTVQTPTSNTFSTPASSGKRQSKAAISVKTEKLDSVRVRGARVVKEIFEEVYPRWQALVKIKSEGGLEGKERGCGLERFESGYVLTRLICKGVHALSILGEHEYELRVLESLLAQKAVAWHERRALILERYAVKDDEMEWAKKALLACIEALEDDDTHIAVVLTDDIIVFRSKLDRRLTALEKKLKLPPEERHTSEGKLLSTSSVSFEGVRVYHRTASLRLDRTGRNTNDIKPNPSIAQAGDITKFLSPKKPGTIKVDATPVSVKVEKLRERKEEKGKSIWVGRDNLHVSVEFLALQWYEDQGFKGIHSETRIITTLFGILFWDIIFLSIPGAFETPFQTAPLDIAEDAFYHARRDIIDARLKELEDGRGEDIVKKVEAEHKALKTWCVGVDWDLVEEGEIVEIVRTTLGVAPAGQIYLCGMWIQENASSSRSRVQVWIDVLLRAQTAVEVCRVLEQGKGDEHKTGKKGKSKGSTKKRRGKAKYTFGSDSEEEEVQAMCESEDDADALPVGPIRAPTEDAQDETSSRPSTRSRSCTYPPRPSRLTPVADDIEPSTPPHSPKKRKFIPEVIISTPSPKRKKTKIEQSSGSAEV